MKITDVFLGMKCRLNDNIKVIFQMLFTSPKK